MFGKFTIASILSNTRRGNTSINYYKHSSYSSHFHDHTQNENVSSNHPTFFDPLLFMSQNAEQGGQGNATYGESTILGDVDTKCCICLAKASDDYICT